MIGTVSSLPPVPPAPSRTAVEPPEGRAGTSTSAGGGDADPTAQEAVVRPATVLPTTLDALAARIAEATGTPPEVRVRHPPILLEEVKQFYIGRIKIIHLFTTRLYRLI